MSTELAAAFEAFLAARCPPSVVRAIDAGESPDALWNDICSAGWPDALVPEPAGGAGLGLADVRPLVEACGAHALPVPLAETCVARAELVRAGRTPPPGPLALEALEPALAVEDRLAWKAALTTGLIAGAAARVVALTIAYARERVQFGRPIGGFQAVQQRLAVMAEHTAAAAMASALAFDVAASADAAPARPDRVRAAMAKCVAGEAAAAVAAGGHAVHGAIGITAECDLQLYTRRLLAWRTEGGSPAHAARAVGADWWQSRATHSIDYALARIGES